MRRLFAVVVGALVIGALAAVVWSRVADPSQWEVADGGLRLTEEASRGDFRVLLAFGVIGLVAGLLIGLVGDLVLRSAWPGLLLLTGVSVLAALLAWRLGIALGPPDPRTVGDLSDGDRVPSRLAVDSVVPFLTWPLGVLAGVLVASWFPGGPTPAGTESARMVDNVPHDF